MDVTTATAGLILPRSRIFSTCGSEDGNPSQKSFDSEYAEAMNGVRNVRDFYFRVPYPRSSRLSRIQNSNCRSANVRHLRDRGAAAFRLVGHRASRLANCALALRLGQRKQDMKRKKSEARNSWQIGAITRNLGCASRRFLLCACDLCPKKFSFIIMTP